jgi:hypothetical protein
MERKIKLNPETTEKIKKIDGSIIYWSVQLSQAMMRLREVESQVGNLFDFKKTAVLEDLKSQEIDIKDCDVSTVDDEHVVITKAEPKPKIGD